MSSFKNLFWLVATVMLIGNGIYFSYKLKFVQFWFKSIKNSLQPESNEKSKISSFETLNMALASRIGVGSLAGVALALYIGGAGTIFWMWISAIICAVNAFVEAILGVIYRVKNKDGHYEGGPSYYIKKGLGYKNLSYLYALVLVLAYIVGFLTIQANTIVKSMTEVFSINPYLISGSIVLFTFLIVFKGVKVIALVTSVLVPIMSISYILVALLIIIINYNSLLDIFLLIVKEAFNFSSFFMGFLTTFIIGIQRGIFSNEAGIGSGAIAASATDTDNPLKQGFVQILGVYFTTLIICSLTAFIILLSDYQDLILKDVNGIEITQYAFSYHIGSFGYYIIILVLFLFAFSTIITGYFYGESNIKFLLGKIKRRSLIIFRIFVALILFLGGVFSASIIWLIVDIFVVLMAIINIYALFSLRKDVFLEYENYLLRRRGIMKKVMKNVNRK